jgi:hypothetical protein
VSIITAADLSKILGRIEGQKATVERGQSDTRESHENLLICRVIVKIAFRGEN